MTSLAIYDLPCQHACLLAPRPTGVGRRPQRPRLDLTSEARGVDGGDVMRTRTPSRTAGVVIVLSIATAFPAFAANPDRDVFYEPRGVYRGRDEIDRAAGAIKSSHPDFRYQPIAGPEELGNGGRIQWVSGRPGEAAACAGTDFIICPGRPDCRRLSLLRQPRHLSCQLPFQDVDH